MCTSVIVGRNATVDGTLIVARDEDFTQNNWNKYVKGIRQPQYAFGGCCEGGIWKLGNGLSIPIPHKAYRYCGIPDAEGSTEAVSDIGDHYFFEERGVNEMNVAISATNSMGIRQEAQDVDPCVNPGVEEAVILTMILPQASTAREAVELLGGYVENYGAAEANGITMADQEEIWYMEIGSGHHWIAVRVPDNQYLVVANCMRIRGVDLTDTENVMCSKDLFDFVQEKVLLAQPDKKNFDFATAFGYAGKCEEPGSDTAGDSEKYYNVDRIWLAQSILSPSIMQPVRQEMYPLFLEPDEKITVSKVAQVLRAGYEGTELEGKADRPIGVVRTAESHIMVLDLAMPEGLQWTIWQALGTPLGGPYMPIFARMEHVPSQYAAGSSAYDSESAYWKLRSLFSIADRMGAESREEIDQMWQQYEEWLLKEYEQFTCRIKGMNGQETKTAEELAEQFSIDILLRTAQKAGNKRDDLLTKMAVDQQS